MSRSKSGADQLYAAARIVDRRGHEVARAILDYAGEQQRLSVKVADGRWRLFVDEVPPPLRWTCDRCPGADLRGDPLRLLELLRSIYADPTRGTLEMRVG